MGSLTSTPTPLAPWLSLGEASRLLGITPATLRRWADQGDVTAFVTPGGHRRFARATIEALVPRTSARRPLTGLGDSATRVARAYQRTNPARRPAAGGHRSLSEADRMEFKERGRRLLTLLLDHVTDEKRPKSGARLAEAVAAASEYGRRAASLGASLPETVEAFVRFRGAFTGELAAIARRRRLDTQEATALLVEADGAVDRLLVALMNGHGGSAR